ncbi:MAG: T9SS type A sorting domain-containing protein [Chitinophagaceae bacterium]|nr:T9SS type A sorting domain-containing protein [Chitinophagaceae bacterium]
MKTNIPKAVLQSLKAFSRPSLCLIFFLTAIAGANAEFKFSYTYQNITRINGGGTLEKGDIIEIRAQMLVEQKATNVYYRDTIKPGFSLVPNSMKIVTNEGLIFRGPYTDAGGDDLGMTKAWSGTKVLRVNVGKGASNVDFLNFDGALMGGGTIDPGDKPKFYNTKTLFVVAYRLEVTADFGDTVYLGGKFYYTYKPKNKPTLNATEAFSYSGIKIIKNDGLCQNYASASFTAESSFGDGTLQNRVLEANAPGYVKVNLGPNHPDDGEYSIANNTSGNGSTDNTVPIRDGANNRVFNVWDIVGDHTGAADPEVGNPAVAPGTNGGYMLVVNSAYPTGDAYKDSIYGLCPNTYYEFSAWIRNICGYCALDSNGTSPNTPGVLPNLAFTVNGIDYYTTGEIEWNGKWMKRGFIYKTGPAETSFEITIKNNAPGGGGNDWVLDDISLATCYPNLIMNPSDVANVCLGSKFYLSDTIRSYFDNYIYYCWEKSTDGGATWVSTGNCGIGTPVLKNGLWEYVVDTAFTSQITDNDTYFRVKVATTAANLGQQECSSGNSQQVKLEVQEKDCIVQAEDIKSFTGRLEGANAQLSWTTFAEDNLKEIEVQKSTDGMNFRTIGTVLPKHINGGDYQFTDNEELINSAFYRLRLIKKGNNGFVVSEAISLRNYTTALNLKVVNPFQSEIRIDLATSVEGIAELALIDNYGRVLKRTDREIKRGSKTIVWEGMSDLPQGIYILSAQINGMKFRQKIMKHF